MDAIIEALIGTAKKRDRDGEFPRWKAAFAVRDIHLDFELIYSERKTLSIHVYPDCSVVVDAPLGSDEAAIEQKV